MISPMNTGLNLSEVDNIEREDDVIAEKYDLITDESNPLLKRVGKYVDSGNYLDALECLKKMSEAIKNIECAGIAAQQLGYDAKMFMFFYNREPILCVNPILKKIKPIKYNHFSIEGCLSIPNKLFKVKRTTVVRLRYQDAFGKWNDRRFKNYDAIVVQHEYDHVCGVLISDIGIEVKRSDFPDFKLKEKL